MGRKNTVKQAEKENESQLIKLHGTFFSLRKLFSVSVVRFGNVSEFVPEGRKEKNRKKEEGTRCTRVGNK
jgi:hypothetical protein